jgi:hypothetical protein
MQSRRLFVACAPDFIRRAAIRALVFLRLPAQAERDVEAALGRVSPSSQVFLIGAAQDGGVPDEQAVERLACLWVAASSVNLTDDIADGDCDYLPARVAPGVGFLLQSLAMSLAIRGGVSTVALGQYSIALSRAAAGQSLEVRTDQWKAESYIEVAQLIAGEQYAAYFGILWDGTAWAERATQVGQLIGLIGLAATDVASRDRRFSSLTGGDKQLVLGRCRSALTELNALPLPSLKRFERFAAEQLQVA